MKSTSVEFNEMQNETSLSLSNHPCKYYEGIAYYKVSLRPFDKYIRNTKNFRSETLIGLSKILVPDEYSISYKVSNLMIVM